MPTNHDLWARTVLAALRTEWPYHAGHMSLDPNDCDVTPRRLHPSFYGSLDWHSSAHMQLSALRLLATGDLSTDLADDLTAELDARLTPDATEVEAAYLRQHPGFERPYGWAWAWLLAAEAASTPWAEATQIVAHQVRSNLLAWLPRLAYPVRYGMHANTAFALGLCLDACALTGDGEAAATIQHHSHRLFADDRGFNSRGEPSGSDFLSPTLAEAELMRRVLGDDAAAWIARFLPGLGADDDPLLATPVVLDESDGHAVHLYGLGLSRAAMLRRLAPFTDRPATITAAAQRQAHWATPAVTDGDFMSTHWLVTFALEAERAAR